MNPRCITVVLQLTFAAVAYGASEPRWLSVMPLPENALEETAADAARQANDTFIDGIAYSCTLVPEGDPVVDKAAVLAARYRKVAPLVAAKSSVAQGVLFQATMGHGYRPGSPTPWQKVVNCNGGEMYKFCPLGREFLDYIRNQARTMAAVKPRFFMVDDDTRLENIKMEGCFCPLHIAELSRRTGRAWTREALVAALESRKDAALRKAWTKLIDDSLAGLFTVIREEFDPSVPGMFCTVSSCLRDAKRFAVILAGPGHRPVIRGGSAPYWGYGLRDILANRRLISSQRRRLGAGVDFLHEADTCPHTRWATSSVRAFDHMLISTLEGCRGAKIWITRMQNPHETKSAEAYRDIYSRNAGLMKYIASADVRLGGVAVPPIGSVPDWGEAFFGVTGIPYRYGYASKGEVTALTRALVTWMDSAQITNILRGAVLLDGSAAVDLARRGFGPLIGVQAKTWTGKTVSFERDENGLAVRGALGANAADLRNRNKAAEEITRLYNLKSSLSSDAEYLAPGSLYFRNGLGGRVVTFAASVQKPPARHVNAAYFCETRKNWVLGALRRLGGRSIRICYDGDAPVMCETGVSAKGDELFILDNLDLDPLDVIPVTLPGDGIRVERMQGDGRWVPVRVTGGKNGRCVLETPLMPHQPTVFRMTGETR